MAFKVLDRRRIRKLARKGHQRGFKFANGVECQMNCFHLMVDGQAVQYLWANFYNKVGAEFASACKVMPQKTRWRSCQCIDDSSGFMKKLIADCGVFQGQWVRLTFSYGDASS